MSIRFVGLLGWLSILAMLSLAAPRMAADTPIVANFAGFDSVHSGVKPGAPCVDAGSTAQSDSAGFTYNINWNCFSGQLKVTGSVRVDYSSPTISWTSANPYWTTATAMSALYSTGYYSWNPNGISSVGTTVSYMDNSGAIQPGRRRRGWHRRPGRLLGGSDQHRTSHDPGPESQCHILSDSGDHPARIVGQPILAAAGFQPATAAPKTRTQREKAA
jgi:hypothetical protein